MCTLSAWLAVQRKTCIWHRGTGDVDRDCPVVASKSPLRCLQSTAERESSKRTWRPNLRGKRCEARGETSGLLNVISCREIEPFTCTDPVSDSVKLYPAAVNPSTCVSTTGVRQHASWGERG